MSANDPLVSKIFVVLDPTRMVQPALERAEWIAKRNEAALHVYCCLETSEEGDEESELSGLAARHTAAWADRLAARARGEGLSVTVEVETSVDWREAIVAAAARAQADLIVKTVSLHGTMMRRLTRTSDWTLLRSCPCPVLLVNPEAVSDMGKVLAAVKLKPGDQVYTGLNERVVDMSHRIAQTMSAELHAVTVYKGEDIYFDRQRFADSCRLPRNRVHTAEGSTHTGIAEVANRIGAGVLIVGCARSPETGTVIGGTAQRVIDHVRSDVVVLPAA